VTDLQPSTRLRYRRVTMDEALALVQEPVVLGDSLALAYPDEGTRFFALRMLERGTDDRDVFGMYHVIEQGTGVLIGHVGFHGGPDSDHVVRIGYAISADARRQGHAGEALRWIVDLALVQPGVKVVRADTSLDNVASQRVLEGHGFVLVRADAESRFYEISCRNPG
jgi:RimJ/RimL family protein N-acetyltransferase